MLTTVAQAEVLLAAKPKLEGYLPIDGIAAYNKALQELLFSPSSPLLPSIATVQTPGGTAAVCLAAHLIRRILPKFPAVAIPDPSWPNHRTIFSELGFAVSEYPYYDSASRSVRMQELLSFLKGLPQRTVVVLHACCHNPTGKDFSASEWEILGDFFAQSGHIPLIDFAYQGFKHGLVEDAAPIRRFAEKGIPCLIAVSLSKSFSLYSHRVGALHVVTSGSDEKARVLSQLKQIVRAVYSNPPAYGARLVTEILLDPKLRTSWEAELTGMRERISAMRTQLVKEMLARGYDFSHVTSQFGMFSYTGLSATQVQTLREKFSIYMMSTGRISVPALNPSNMAYICDAIAEVARR
jgi:aromatic-amino-acid transaminase